jgi:hypothetical protein
LSTRQPATERRDDEQRERRGAVEETALEERSPRQKSHETEPDGSVRGARRTSSLQQCGENHQKHQRNAEEAALN